MKNDTDDVYALIAKLRERHARFCVATIVRTLREFRKSANALARVISLGSLNCLIKLSNRDGFELTFRTAAMIRSMNCLFSGSSSGREFISSKAAGLIFGLWLRSALDLVQARQRASTRPPTHI